VNEDALRRLRSDPIDWRYKGFPPAEGVTPASVGAQGWNLLAGDLFLPALVLRESALAHNLALMSRWCDVHGVSLAPHGKTTMSPELFARQLDAGAWAMTAATASQARVYRAFGVERILLANELVEPASLRWIASELAADPSFDFLCIADSVEAVTRMDRALDGHAKRPLRVLVELGIAGGRTGARSIDRALEVAEAIGRSAALELAGVEGYEGIVHDDARVEAFLAELRELADRLAAAGSFADQQEIVVTAGGSIYFDRVAERLPSRAPRTRIVVRSGCYLTHDDGLYDEHSPLGSHASTPERLLPAFEAWAVVLSRPEPGLALVGMGKRDVPHDVGLPIPLKSRGQSGVRDVRESMEVVDLNDQHAYVRTDPSDPLAVGDLLGCGISHPCTAFDKWRLIPVVDDDYAVIDAVHTFF
jgi:D-serine deaminase-like pyridoxal phosphate-dependent protein